MDDYSINAVLKLDTTTFNSNLKKATTSVKTFSSSLETITKTLGGLFVGSQIVNFTKRSIKAIEEERKELRLLNTTLKTTEASAWITSERLVSMADEFEKSSNYTKEEILRMQTVLLGFKSITGDVFESASEEIINMAEVMGMDLVSAVQTVGKALDNPITGLGSLQRQGFFFTEQEKEMLEQMIAVGDKAKAQKIILDELATTYGGAGKAGKDAFKSLEIAIGDLEETVGKILTPLVKNMAEGIVNVLNNFNSLNETTKTFILTSGALSTTFPLIIKGIKGLKVALVSLQSSVPTLLAITAGISAISLVISKIKERRNAFGNLTEEIETLRKSTNSFLDTYSGGNEAKTLDEKATKKLIELYPQLSGEIHEYSTSVDDARKAVENLINQKLLDAESTGIQYYIDRLNEISKLQEKVNKYTSHNNKMDEARANEILTKDIPAVRKLAEAQRQAINERLKLLGKELTFDGKIINIQVEVTPSPTIDATGSAKKRWQEVLAEVFEIDESSFETGEKAVELYLDKLNAGIEQNESITNALGEKFNIVDILKTKAGTIETAIESILSNVDIDDPFQVSELTKDGSALNTLAEEYRAIMKTIKSIEIEEEINELQIQVDNLGKSELELYEAQLRANGATDEQVEKAIKLKKKLEGISDDTFGKFKEKIGEIFNSIKEKLKMISKFLVPFVSSVKKSFATAGNVIISLFNNVFKSVKSLVGSIKLVLGSMFRFDISDALDTLLEFEDAILTFFVETLPKLPSFFKEAIESISNLVTSIDLTGLADIFQKVIDVIVENLPSMAQNVFSAVSTLFQTVFTSIKNNASSITKALGDIILSAVKELPALAGTFAPAFLEVIKGIATYIVENIDTFTNVISETISTLINALVEFIKGGGLKMVLDALLAIQKALEKIVVDNIEDLVDVIVEALPDIVETLIDSIVSASSTLSKIAEPLVELIAQLFISILEVISDEEVFKASIDTVEALVKALVKAFVKNAPVVAMIFAELASNIVEYFPELIIAIIKGFIEGIVEALVSSDFWENLGKSIKDEFKKCIEGLNLVGDFIAGFIKGIFDLLDYVLEKIGQFFTFIIDKIKDVLGIHSPSTVMADIGKNLVLGLWEGISSLAEWIYDKISDFASTIADKLSSVFSGIGDWFSSIGSGIGDWFSSVSSGIGDWFDSVSSGIGDWFSSLGSNISDASSNIVDNIEDIWSTVSDTVSNVVSNIGSTASDIASNVGSTASSVASSVASAVSSAVSTATSTVKNVVKKLKFWATGTNNAPRGLSIVGEQGPELIDMRGGERVYSAQNTKGILNNVGGNNSFNVTFNNVQDTTAYTMMRQLRGYNRQMKLNGVI